MPIKTNRQIEADKRRQHILETAVRAFLELGYQRAGVREIAKRAGVSLGNLYNHFPSKEAVLIEIARLEALKIAPFVEQLRADKPAQDRLQEFLEGYLRYAAEADNVLLAVEILAEAVRTSAVADAFAPTRKSLISGIFGCLSALNPSDKSNQVDKARLILDLVEAHARHLVFSGKGFSEREVATVVQMVGSGIGLSSNA
ncbi:TetR/AcrR family transcriptional regulator [uncultured Roseovarius sp.]|uniref:TetR/AcrR family transcriptional regulator n=1 Tax=uncultured Roseovarius sp. TaxID=293344 RepID=UPI002616CA40|nr:TetR/AcrR family transcriptional regulator [uncultured Roseovarius sp.]